MALDSFCITSVRHHFGQQTSCIMPLTLDIHPAEICLSFPSILLNTQHQNPVFIVSFSFHNKKLQFPLKTAVDTSLLDQCVSLPTSDEWREVLGQKNLIKWELSCLNKTDGRYTHKNTKAKAAAWIIIVILCHMPIESLTTAKLSTCYHTTHPADQSLFFCTPPVICVHLLSPVSSSAC